jgi:hypothetical protein
VYPSLALSQAIFASDMTTYYCNSMEEVLKRAKATGKRDLPSIREGSDRPVFGAWKTKMM